MDNKRTLDSPDTNCSLGFERKDLLDTSSRKHDLSLTLTPTTPFRNIFIDGTPTPTRFLNALESEVMEELGCDNPFDATFRKANSTGVHTFIIPDEPSSSLLDSEVLNTPSITLPPDTPSIFLNKKPKEKSPPSRTNVITSVGTVVKQPTVSQGVPTAVVVTRPVNVRNIAPVAAEKTTPLKAPPPQPAVVQSVTVTPMVQLMLRLPDGQTMPVQFPMVNSTTNPPSLQPAVATESRESTKLKLKEVITNNQKSSLSVKPSVGRGAKRMALEEVLGISPPSSPSSNFKRYSHPDDLGDKRKRSLERNRAAATRCREKRKLWVTALERKADELAQTNTLLNNEVSQLRNEVAQLKTMLLAHKDCPVTMQQRRTYAIVSVDDLQQSNSDSSLTSDNSEASFKER